MADQFDTIQTVELKPGRAVVEGVTLGGWRDGMWLEFRVVGNSGPTRIAFASSQKGNPADPEYDLFFDPTNEATGLYSIPPEDLESVAEGATLYWTIWEKIDGKPVVKATGTATKGAAIKVPDFGGTPVLDLVLQTLTLTAAEVQGSALRGTVVGEIEGAQPTSSITMPDTASGLFAVQGRKVVVASSLANANTVESITLRETRVGASNSPLDTTISITIGDFLGQLALSSYTVPEDALVGSLVATVQGRSTNSTLTLPGNSGGLFEIDSATGQITLAGALDYETAQSHDITVREELAVASNSPLDHSFTINVGDVIEATLSALTLDNSSIAEDAVQGEKVGDLLNVSIGSTLEMVSDAGGLFDVSGQSIVRGAANLDHESAAAHQVVVRETNGDASNSPRDTTLVISVSNIAEDVSELGAAAQRTTADLAKIEVVYTEPVSVGNKVRVHIGTSETFADGFARDLIRNTTYTTGNGFPDLTYVVLRIVRISDSAVISEATIATLAAVGATVTAPTAAGALVDQTFTQNTGTQVYDTAGDFTTGGGTLTFSLPTAPSGVTVDSATGVVSIDTAVTGLLSASTVSVRATNSAGSVDSAFSLTVEAATVGDTITSFSQFSAFHDSAQPFQYDETALRTEIGATEPAGGYKVPGVDPTPAGCSWNATSRVFNVGSGFVGSLEGWDLTDVRLDINREPAPEVIDCLFGDTAANVEFYLAGGWNVSACVYVAGPSPTSTGVTLRNCTYRRDNGYPLGRGNFFDSKRNCGGFFFVDCDFDGIPNDFSAPDVGVAGLRSIVNLRAFDDTPYYDAGTTYARNDFVLNADGKIYRSKVDGNLGNTPPAGKSGNDAFWIGYDPHQDLFQSKSARTEGAVSPAAILSEDCIFRFDGRSEEQQVALFWTQFSNGNAGDTFYTHGFRRCAFLRDQNRKSMSIKLPTTAVDVAAPAFDRCWVTFSNGGYAEGDIPALWTNNRDAESGAIAPAPNFCETSAPLKLLSRTSIGPTTEELVFNRTPILTATGVALSGSRKLIVNTEEVTQISGGAIQDVAGNTYGTVLDFTGVETAAVMAVIGQSENVKGFVMNNQVPVMSGPYPDLLPGVDVQILIPAEYDKSGVATVREVTQANIDGGFINSGMVALANAWHVGSGGRPLRVIAIVKSGTGMLEMMSDGLTGRSFATDLATAQTGEAAFGPTQRVTYAWYNAEAPAAQDLWNRRASLFFGINPDGSAYDFEGANPDGIDHCLIDTTGRGYGMLPDTCKVDLMYPGLYYPINKLANGTNQFATNDIYDPEFVNYSTNGLGVRVEGQPRNNAHPAYLMRRDFVDRSPSANRGTATITPALMRYGDYENGVQLSGPTESGIHPSLQSVDGQIRYGQEVAISFLVSFGYLTVPTIKRWETEASGAYIDAVIDIPAGSTLTTQFIQEGLAEPASPAPHEQEVMGFEIRRVGDTDRTQRPVYRAGLAGYPTEYRGTVAIQNTGTDVAGGREGVVRITPEVAFADGDVVRLGWEGSYATFILRGYLDYDLKLYRKALRVYQPGLDDGSATSYPGVPVTVQEDYTVGAVSGGGGEPAGSRAIKADGVSAPLEGPTIDSLAGTVTSLTSVFVGRVGVQSGFGTKSLIGASSKAHGLYSDTRAGNRTAAMEMEDGTGGGMFGGSSFALISGSGIIPNDGADHTFMLTQTHDDGAGNARSALYIDGALVEERVLPVSTSPFFQKLQSLRDFAADVSLEVTEIRKFLAFSPDGTEPTTGKFFDRTGEDLVNETLPPGWSIGGTGAWTAG